MRPTANAPRDRLRTPVRDTSAAVVVKELTLEFGPVRLPLDVPNPGQRPERGRPGRTVAVLTTVTVITGKQIVVGTVHAPSCEWRTPAGPSSGIVKKIKKTWLYLHDLGLVFS